MRRPAAAIIAALKATHPDVPVIAFPRGAGLAYDGFAEATGADCIGLDATVPLKRLASASRFSELNDVVPCEARVWFGAVNRDAGSGLARDAVVL